MKKLPVILMFILLGFVGCTPEPPLHLYDEAAVVCAAILQEKHPMPRIPRYRTMSFTAPTSRDVIIGASGIC